MSTLIVKTYVMVKEVAPNNLGFKQACLVLGKNHLTMHRRGTLFSILSLTGAEGMIYHTKPGPFVWL